MLPDISKKKPSNLNKGMVIENRKLVDKKLPNSYKTSRKKLKKLD